ncbi:MAG TPA: Ku protein [Lacipirellulaceae bacterium]|nr:Ku protein [Lacipirellulaceae bacterium]
MSRPIWKGHVSFGLVNVPVVLNAAEQRVGDLSFRMIDSRNSARVRYERVNEETGEEVPWDKIVKGYEYEDGNYVLMSEEELEHASPEMTRTIEIEQFVDLEDIDVRYYERPYVLLPDKKGEKGYVLLREAIREAGKAGIARVVIRARQYLAALIPQGDALVLELLRYDQELVDLKEFDLPSSDLRQVGVNRKEIDLAMKLIGGMTTKWNATKYHDEYREALMKLVQKKVAAGQTEAIEDVEEDESPIRQTINFMDVLKKSVEHASRGKGKTVRAPKKVAVSHRGRRTRKKQAG